jgi:hypothetical protein
LRNEDIALTGPAVLGAGRSFLAAGSNLQPLNEQHRRKSPVDLLNDLVANPPKYGVIGTRFSRITADPKQCSRELHERPNHQ